MVTPSGEDSSGESAQWALEDVALSPLLVDEYESLASVFQSCFGFTMVTNRISYRGNPWEKASKNSWLTVGGVPEGFGGGSSQDGATWDRRHIETPAAAGNCSQTCPSFFPVTQRLTPPPQIVLRTRGSASGGGQHLRHGGGPWGNIFGAPRGVHPRGQGGGVLAIWAWGRAYGTAEQDGD